MKINVTIQSIFKYYRFSIGGSTSIHCY